MLKNLRKNSESITVDLGNVKMHTKSRTAVPLFVNLDDNYQPHPTGQGSPHKYSILFVYGLCNDYISDCFLCIDPISLVCIE
jgi:hypothetical protein